jgi:hypothetical protein
MICTRWSKFYIDRDRDRDREKGVIVAVSVSTEKRGLEIGERPIFIVMKMTFMPSFELPAASIDTRFDTDKRASRLFMAATNHGHAFSISLPTANCALEFLWA